MEKFTQTEVNTILNHSDWYMNLFKADTIGIEK